LRGWSGTPDVLENFVRVEELGLVEQSYTTNVGFEIYQVIVLIHGSVVVASQTRVSQTRRDIGYAQRL